MTEIDLPFEATPPQNQPPRGLSLASIILLVGVALTAVVFGLALLRQNQTQPTAGPAPAFTVPTYDGQEFDLAAYRGKIVVVNFWASWCGPCRDEAPVLQSVWEKYKDRGVTVLGIAYSDTETKSRAFIDEFDLTYPNGPDVGTRVSDLYNIQGVPETFVIDQEGNIAQFIYAQVKENELSALLDDLLERDV